MMETEKRNPKTKNIDKATSAEIVAMINEANYDSVKAVEAASAEIAAAIDLVTEALQNGGRLVYMGASIAPGYPAEHKRMRETRTPTTMT